jgi:hypothetical protein
LIAAGQKEKLAGNLWLVSHPACGKQWPPSAPTPATMFLKVCKKAAPLSDIPAQLITRSF